MPASWIDWFWFFYFAVVGALCAQFVGRKAWRFDYWIGHSDEGPVVMRVKKICRIPFTGWQLHLHQMIAADRAGCFHTHPAYAIRIPIWGGYLEQCLPDTYKGTEAFAPYKLWLPGMIGLVRPELCHRVASLRARTSWSLWFRGPCRYPIDLKGEGWRTCAICLKRNALPQPPYPTTICNDCLERAP